VWTFDEGGGYYDHVPPPAAVAPDDIGPDWPAPAYTGFAQYGYRVPAVVVSPWSRANHVTSVVHDHTSILAMAERKWNLPALTHRDAAANDLSDFLDLNQPTHAGHSARRSRPARLRENRPWTDTASRIGYSRLASAVL